MTDRTPTSTTGSSAMAVATLNALEARLRRLEFLLTGESDLDGVPASVARITKHSDTVSARLEQLQADLSDLKNIRGIGGSLVRDVDALYTKYPEVFKTAPSSPTSSLDLATEASIVLSHASLYPETASRLSSLQSLQMPTAEQSAKLVELALRIEQAKKMQAQLEDQARELRERSARILQWWVEIGCVGMGGLWEDWMSRVGEIERQVQRREKNAKEEEGYL